MAKQRVVMVLYIGSCKGGRAFAGTNVAIVNLSNQLTLLSLNRTAQPPFAVWSEYKAVLDSEHSSGITSHTASDPESSGIVRP
jgi:hypothetical protein